MSRIGKKPITIPKDVKIGITKDSISVESPKGALKKAIPENIIVESKDGMILVRRNTNDKPTRAAHGLMRALIVNMLKGITEGYSKTLEITGVGFRAKVSETNLTLNLGFSHPVVFPIPKDIKIETPKQTQIVIKGIDKEKVGQIAAEIRAIFPPEPYKGKGIRYLNEFVRKKIGKAAAATTK